MFSLRSKRNSGKEGKQRGVHTPSTFEGSAITFPILALSNFFHKTEPNPFDCEANNQRAGAACTNLQHKEGWTRFMQIHSAYTWKLTGINFWIETHLLAFMETKSWLWGKVLRFSQPPHCLFGTGLY